MQEKERKRETPEIGHHLSSQQWWNTFLLFRNSVLAESLSHGHPMHLCPVLICTQGHTSTTTSIHQLHAHLEIMLQHFSSLTSQWL